MSDFQMVYLMTDKVVYQMISKAPLMVGFEDIAPSFSDIHPHTWLNTERGKDETVCTKIRNYRCRIPSIYPGFAQMKLARVVRCFHLLILHFTSTFRRLFDRAGYNLEWFCCYSASMFYFYKLLYVNGQISVY